jgi:hypothetical protein
MKLFIMQMEGHGLHKVKIRFFDRRNDVLEEERSRAKIFARSGGEKKNDLDKVSWDIGNMVSRKLKNFLDKNSGYETLCRISGILTRESFISFNIEEINLLLVISYTSSALPLCRSSSIISAR